MEMLKKAGAVAVKPTGSGGGGYVLSLWTTQPPEELLSKLIPC
jgi:mevalonate kinase